MALSIRSSKPHRPNWRASGGGCLRCLAISISLASVTVPALTNAASTPIAGFQPLVGIGLTDEFKDDFSDTFFISETSLSPGGNWLGQGGTPYFDVALLDSGAAVSLINSAAYEAFDILGAEFDGTQLQQLGGATGFLFATVEDPLGIYATGLANRTTTAPLGLATNTMRGQTSVSLLTLPPESSLPNILGLSFASQYKTTIRSDQPQIFSLHGNTVRTPQINFGTLGSGGEGILRRAPLTLSPSSSFLTPPLYVFNFENILNGEPLTENPSNPTNIQGGLFLNVDLANDGGQLNNSQFFFDTGADVTVVSQLNAKRLGFDPILDTPDFTIPVLGSGGTLQAVPGFFVDQLTISTVGGSFTATNVPVIALDVTDPSSPGNIVPGILGTNVLSGRNLVIDPNPALGGGGVGPSLYISDPVTTAHAWTSAASQASWGGTGNWNATGTPSVLWQADVTHVTGGAQVALVDANSTVWDLDIEGSTGQAGSASDMTVRVAAGATLTTFSGINVMGGGALQLSDGTVDTQFVEVLGGTLSGRGTLKSGNGPIKGQVELRQGLLAPGDTGSGNSIGKLTIQGLFASSSNSTLQFDLAGKSAGLLFDQVVIEGDAKLSGTLEVKLASGYAPTIGDSFDLLVVSDGIGGTFESLQLPNSFQWDVLYGEDRVTLAVTGLGFRPGDFNQDGAVDALDAAIMFGVWGQTSPIADLDQDGIIDAADAAILFGNWTGDAAPQSVPEPLGGSLCAGFLWVYRMRRRDRS